MWLFYGSNNFPADERPPIPYVPELDDPTWRPVYGRSLRLYLLQMLMNSQDPCSPCGDCLLTITSVNVLADSSYQSKRRSWYQESVDKQAPVQALLQTVVLFAGEIEFKCNHWSVFENAIDMAHIHYLHSDSFGNQESPQIKGMKTTHNAYGVKASFGLHNKPVNKFWEFSQVRHLVAACADLLLSMR